MTKKFEKLPFSLENFSESDIKNASKYLKSLNRKELSSFAEYIGFRDFKDSIIVENKIEDILDFLLYTDKESLSAKTLERKTYLEKSITNAILSLENEFGTLGDICNKMLFNGSLKGYSKEELQEVAQTIGSLIEDGKLKKVVYFSVSDKKDKK